MSDLISRQAAIEAVKKIEQIFINNLSPVIYRHEVLTAIFDLPSAQPEPLVNESRTLVNDLVNDTISRQAAIDGIKEYIEEYSDTDANGLHDLKWCAMKEAEMLIEELPSAQPEDRCSECDAWNQYKYYPRQPEWNNHTVACMLADLFGDTCACNYNGIDEWLPLKCELLDSCPNPVGVACWEQFLKHRAERRNDAED